MILLSVLLSWWLPVLGPFIAGYVGGKKAGSVGRALLVCLLPALIVGGAAFLLVTVTTAYPGIGAVIGAVVAGTVGLAIVTGEFSLICGAIVGGALA